MVRPRGKWRQAGRQPSRPRGGVSCRVPSRERPASTRFPLRGNDEGGAPSLPHRASTGRNGHAQNAVSSSAADTIRQQSDRYSDVLLHNSDTIRHPSDSLLTPDEEAARSGTGVVFSQGVGFCRVRQARLVGFAPSNRQRSAWVGIGERSGCHIVSGPSCNSWGDATPAPAAELGPAFLHSPFRADGVVRQAHHERAIPHSRRTIPRARLRAEALRHPFPTLRAARARPRTASRLGKRGGQATQGATSRLRCARSK